MVHIAPGESAPHTAFLDPHTLAELGYDGQVVLSVIEGVPTFDRLSVSPLPKNSAERAWANHVADHLDSQIEAAHAAGLRCLAWMQLVVFPIPVVQAYKSDICDAQGRIDVTLPMAQKLLRIQLGEIFDRFPRLDGLVIRTGEVYLHDLPFHASTAATEQQKMQGATAILHGEQSHLALLRILREEVCVARGRSIYYRTWDFGNNFHSNPAYYLRVTENVAPHPKLFFSIKHQKGDFHQLTAFNPTLMIGKHRQIVEVQCQREAYGKAAHPYYIGKGVIDGWEEMAQLMKHGEPRGLRDIIRHPLYAGTWTWSRGGGWDGPYIQDEMWCALNAYVISRFTEDPDQDEAEIVAAYAKSIGLKLSDVALFHEMQLLTPGAVVRGQLTMLLLPESLSGGKTLDIWWCRDDKLGDPNLSEFIDKGLVEAAINEKREARRIWNRISSLASRINWPTAAMKEFVMTSVAYGGFKLDVIRNGWTVLLLGRQGDSLGAHDKHRIRAAVAEYDKAWLGWRQLKAAQQSCATLYKGVAFADKPGLDAAVDVYRGV